MLGETHVIFVVACLISNVDIFHIQPQNVGGMSRYCHGCDAARASPKIDRLPTMTIKYIHPLFLYRSFRLGFSLDGLNRSILLTVLVTLHKIYFKRKVFKDYVHGQELNAHEFHSLLKNSFETLLKVLNHSQCKIEQSLLQELRIRCNIYLGSNRN